MPNPISPRRRSIRIPGYDYTQPGVYFVTICVRDRECALGDIVDGRMVLNGAGRIVQESWNRIARHFPNAITDTFIVMPNHVHGIVIITDPVGATHASPLQPDEPDVARGPKPGSLGAIVGSFKSASARRINALRGTQGISFWQRGYYERIVCDDAELERIREYIAGNPHAWETDADNPSNIAVVSP